MHLYLYLYVWSACQVEDSWKTLEFMVLPFKDFNDVFILSGTDDVQVNLDESNINVQTIASSRHVGPIKPRVDEWVQTLEVFHKTLVSGARACCPGFFIRGGGWARPKNRRPRAGVGFLGRGSNAPPQLWVWEPRPPKRFPLFSALRMASPDTIILLIVDYRAAIGRGGKTPVTLLVYAPAVAAVFCNYKPFRK